MAIYDISGGVFLVAAAFRNQEFAPGYTIFLIRIEGWMGLGAGCLREAFGGSGSGSGSDRESWREEVRSAQDRAERAEQAAESFELRAVAAEARLAGGFTRSTYPPVTAKTNVSG